MAGLRSYLAASGTNVAGEIAKGSLVLSPEPEHLVNGQFDADRMIRALDEAVNHSLVKTAKRSMWRAAFE